MEILALDGSDTIHLDLFRKESDFSRIIKAFIGLKLNNNSLVKLLLVRDCVNFNFTLQSIYSKA
jgi:hypothetical protein